MKYKRFAVKNTWEDYGASKEVGDIMRKKKVLNTKNILRLERRNILQQMRRREKARRESAKYSFGVNT